MKLVLVGPGALGCLLAARLTGGLDAGDQLTLLDHNEKRAKFLHQRGVIYHIGTEQLTIPISTASNPKELGPVDVVLLCVKSYDVAASLAFCRPLLNEQTLLLFFQNGITHLNLSLPVPGLIPAYGTTTEGATLLGPGEVRHAGSGTTFLGFTESSHASALIPLLQAACDVMTRGGLKVELTNRITEKLWAKLFVNIAINGLTGIFACNNGALLAIPEAASRMTTAIDEAIHVAAALNLAIPDDPQQTARTVCRNTAENISSMLQDIRNHKRTEIDAINGAICAYGHKMGIPTPENDRIVAQIKAIEARYL
jgi:2-dehydropantoate 2-reductase